MGSDLIIIAISMLIWGVGESSFIAFQALYLQKLGALPLQIGTIFGAAGLAAALVYIPVGFLSDRLGRRPLVWAGWFQGLAAAWVMAIASSLNWFIVGMIMYGMTMYVTTPLNSYVTAARGKLSVARAITLISAAYNLGAILGPFFGGWLGEKLGFRTIFLFAAVLFIPATILILWIKPQPRETLSPHETRNGLLSNQRFLAFIPIVFLVILATALPQPLSPNYLQNQQGLSLENIGQLYSLMGVGIVIFNLVLGQLDPRIGFLMSQVAVGLFAAFLWKGNSLLAFGIGYFLLGGFRTVRSFAIAQARPLIHGSNMGLAYGLLESSGALALILAAPLAGYLYSYNPGLMYILSLLLILGAIVVSLVFAYNRHPHLYEESLPIE
jgi:MFS family permease